MELLKIAIQKSGRLHDDSIKLMSECGIAIDNGKGQLKARARNFDLEVYFLRNSDIPQYLKDGVVDAAIIGENLLVENGETIRVAEKLGFSKCRVSLAVPKNANYKNVEDLQGKRIATSYPNTLKKFLKAHKVEADLHIINGSVEIAPNIGLSEAICDIVSSGSTLFRNNLREVEVIGKSEAVMAVSPAIEEKQQHILENLLFRLRSVLKARAYRYVLMNAPNNTLDQIIALLPGMRSPTVLPLAEEGWSSIHTVIKKDAFWEVIEEIKEAGAEGILVCPIEKMVL